MVYGKDLENAVTNLDARSLFSGKSMQDGAMIRSHMRNVYIGLCASPVRLVKSVSHTFSCPNMGKKFSLISLDIANDFRLQC
jgi:hypothetical protein